MTSQAVSFVEQRLLQGPNKYLISAIIRAYDAEPSVHLAGNPEQDLEKWAEARMQELPDYRPSGEVEIAAGYPEFTDSNWLRGGLADYASLLHRLKGWQLEGHEDLRLNIAIGATDPVTSTVESQALVSADGLVVRRFPPPPPPEGSSLHDMELFFACCNEQFYWDGEHATLDRSKASLQAHGIDLESMNSVTSEEWKAAGLPGGFRYRLPKQLASCRSEQWDRKRAMSRLESCKIGLSRWSDLNSHQD